MTLSNDGCPAGVAIGRTQFLEVLTGRATRGQRRATASRRLASRQESQTTAMLIKTEKMAVSTITVRGS